MSIKFIYILFGMLFLSAVSFAQVKGSTEAYTEEIGEWEDIPEEEQAALNAQLQALIAEAQSLYTAEEVAAAEAQSLPTDAELKLIALDEAVTKASKITKATRTDIDELTAAINAYRIYCWEPGDVNHDKVVDVLDAAAVINRCLGNYDSGFDADLADMNADGDIDSADVIAIVDKCLDKK